MNITRYNPFSDLVSWHPFSDEFFKGFPMRPLLRTWEGEPQMRLDVDEDDKSYTVKAEIPGVKKEEISISIDGNRVAISAEVKKETEEKKDNKVVRSERYYGSVSRSFSLDHEIDDTTATAKYENGVLVLTLPKKAGTVSKKLSVT